VKEFKICSRSLRSKAFSRSRSGAASPRSPAVLEETWGSTVHAGRLEVRTTAVDNNRGEEKV